MAPSFSIITATWNRGRHIVPTIRSVLQQSFTDYELLIVGDHCDDDTEAAVRPFLSERVRWMNLPQRSGNQYGPNNAGIEASRGRYIGYLGHDDVWTPNHLAAIHRVFTDNPDVGFAVSGCICYGPPGSGFHVVSGMFDGDEAKFTDFFPPSTFAHIREVPAIIGQWRAPTGIKAPPDCDFLLRAAAAGLRFASTGELTVHKCATGSRYLAYANPESDEQALFLRMMGSSSFDDFVAAVIAQTRKSGRYMALKYPDYGAVPDGHYHAQLEVGRGIARPPLVRLDGEAVVRQDDKARLVDWAGLVTRDGTAYRWSGVNPRPRMMLPLTGRGRTRMRFVVHGASDAGVLDKLRLSVNGEPVPWRFHRRHKSGKRGIVECHAELKADDYSVVEFDLTGGIPLEDLVRCADGRPERIALGDVRLRAAHVHGLRKYVPRFVRSIWAAAR